MQRKLQMIRTRSKQTAPNLSTALCVALLLTGCGGSDSSSTPEPPTPTPSNSPPVVSTADNFSNNEQTTITLSATASDADGSIASYTWSQITGSNVTLVDATTATANFLAPDVTADETLTFEVTVTDDQGASSSDRIDVTILRVNQIPVAIAGDDINIEINNLVTLSGAASSDLDNDSLSYLWTFQAPSGSLSTLSSLNDAAPTFTPDIAGEYVARLIVNDGFDDSAYDEMTVLVSAPPVIGESTVSGKIVTFNASNSEVQSEPEEVLVTITMLDQFDQVVATQTPDVSQIPSFNELRFSSRLTGNDPFYVNIEVALSGYTTYSRRLDIQDNIVVDAKLQEISSTEVVNSSTQTISGMNNDGFNFDLANQGDAAGLSINIPTNLLPDEVDSLMVAAKSYDPNSPDDAEFFPGEYADSSGQQLVSVAFNYAEVMTDAGEPVQQAMQRKRLQRLAARGLSANAKLVDEEPVIINRQIPAASCPIMAALGDSDLSTEGFQVPVYTYNPTNGLWDLLGQGTVYDNLGVIVADNTDTFDCTSAIFTLEIMVTNEIFLSKWWNLDYPLVFEQPTTLCANIQVQNQDQLPLSSVVGFLSDKDDSFDFSSSYFITDAQGNAEIEVLQTSSNEDLTAQLYVYDSNVFGYSTSEITLSENCDNPPRQIVTVDRPQQCQVTGKTMHEAGVPAIRNLIYALPTSFPFGAYDFAFSNELGEYNLNLSCDVDYVIYDYTSLLLQQGDANVYEQNINVDGVIDEDEQSDNGNTVLMNDFTVGYYDPLVQVIPVAASNQLYLYAYSTYGSFPLDITIKVINVDGSIEYGTYEYPLETSNDDEEVNWYITYGFSIVDFTFPVTDGESAYIEITVVDAFGNEWSKPLQLLGQF
jgi:hypothetical protein